MALPWILTNDLTVQVILPFLLVFVLIFAILDRIKILGEDKRQINAIASLAIALIFVTFTKATGIITNLMAFLAVFAVIILVFLVLWGFLIGGKEFSVNKGIKIAGGIIIFIALVIAVIIVTGAGDTIKGWFTGSSSNTLISTIVFIAIIGGAVAIVLTSGNKKGS